jgi:hypothetical protein
MARTRRELQLSASESAGPGEAAHLPLVNCKNNNVVRFHLINFRIINVQRIMLESKILLVVNKYGHKLIKAIEGYLRSTSTLFSFH